MQDQPAIGRLRWQCRRGMRELDVVLERWLVERYPSAREDERRAFVMLLDSQDPQLVAWLFGRERPEDPGVAALVDEIAGGRPRPAG
jgi:antitoxin CptB